MRRISKPLPEPGYPTYVVEQPDYETEPVCVVTVNKPNSPVDQSDELLKKLLAVLTPKVPSPARAPDKSPRDKLVQLLLSEAVKREPAPPTPAEPPGLETLLLWWEDWENTQELILFQKPRVGHLLIYIKHKESPVVQSNHIYRSSQFAYTIQTAHVRSRTTLYMQASRQTYAHCRRSAIWERVPQVTWTITHCTP